MHTVGKFMLGMMSQLRPKPAMGDAAAAVSLPSPEKHGGLPLMKALVG